MIAIIDYGVGNIFSLCSSFKYIGADAKLTSDEAEVRRADKILLPGVGAFSDAAAKLRACGMWEVLLDECAKGKPLMGICLGMQMLFEKSMEYGEHKGLALIPGEVVPIAPVVPKDYKIPHIGWNALHFKGEKSPLFKYVNEGECVYFVHSYYASGCEESTIATCEYSAELTAAVQRGNVMGTQFHPEKSGEVGLNILRAFVEM
ncbi:MAG: imidazole glycerol phosphate synthase subunit HisH [Ruminococcaceae bacterium]|nr:imidazole glycerol phosphate synthase subunit HisH [Oscillospiraceae bacterium]